MALIFFLNAHESQICPYNSSELQGLTLECPLFSSMWISQKELTPSMPETKTHSIFPQNCFPKKHGKYRIGYVQGVGKQSKGTYLSTVDVRSDGLQSSSRYVLPTTHPCSYYCQLCHLPPQTLCSVPWVHHVLCLVAFACAAPCGWTTQPPFLDFLPLIPQVSWEVAFALGSFPQLPD